MSYSRGELKLSEFLPYRLSVLTNKISQSLMKIYEKRYDLTPTEWRIIAILAEQADLSAAEVAERTAMDKVSISRAVKHLLANGRVKRHFSEEDRRRSVISLSASGLEIYREIAPKALSYEATLLKELTPEESYHLNILLTKLDKFHKDADDSFQFTLS